MPLIHVLFRQLRASLGEEIREAQKGSEQFLPSSLAPTGFSLLRASQQAASCCLLPFRGLERPPRFPWQQSGVAPDHFGALPASKLRVAPCATSMLPTISPRPWVTPTVTGRVTCVFHAPVTFPCQKRSLNLLKILPLYLEKDLRNKKCKRQIATGTGPCPGSIAFDPRLWTSPGIFPPASIEATSKRSLRICVRNGFTRPAGDINVNFLLYTKSLSRKENLTENLCDLLFSFRRPAHSEAPSSSSIGSDVRMRRSPSRTANSDRGSLR